MNTAALDEFRSARPIAGWRVVFTAFCMALGAWGLGFYALSAYAQFLGRAGRFPPALLSLASTWYFLVGAAALYAVDHAARRFGVRRITLIGLLLMVGGVSALAYVANVALLFIAYTAMAFGWAAISGTAIARIVGLWFDARRGLALNLALTGASAAGFVIVPALVWAIGRFGMGPGVLGVALAVGVPLALLIGFNVVEPERAVLPPGTPPAPAPAALRNDPHLLLLCALFAVGWLAQVAFLAQQLPLLVPKVGATVATLAVAVTTGSSLLGRLVLASVIDRIDHRRATAASFALQALGMVLMLASDHAWAVIAGCALVGASVGNVITLPAMFAQREFAPAHYSAVVTRIWSVGQVLFAFGPVGAGVLQSATGSPTATLLACALCQLLAAALCLRQPAAGRSVANSKR